VHARDRANEAAAFHDIVQQLTDGGSRQLLDSLMRAALRCCGAGSAGLTVLETEPDGRQALRWVALGGALSSYLGRTTPLDASPCGVTLDRGAPQLFDRPARLFSRLGGIRPSIVEALVVPFSAGDLAVGTFWIASHDEATKFDADHARDMVGLAELTAVAFKAKRDEDERQRLLTIVDELVDGIVVCDRERRYIYVNQAAAQILALPPPQILGRRHEELYRDLHDDAFGSALRRATAERRPQRVRSVCEARGRAYESDIAPRPDGTVVVAIRDVTDQMRSETALRESEASAQANERRYRSLIQATAQIVWSADPNGAAWQDSPSWRAFTGLPYGELRGTSWIDAIHPEDRESARRAWNDALARRTPYEIEQRVRRADGSYANMLVRAAPVVAADGTVLGWIGTSSDVTEKKRAEQAARQSRERFFAALSEASLGMALTDLDGKFIEVNSSFCRITGYSMDELQRMDCSTITHPDDRARKIGPLRRALAGEISSFVIEKRYVTKSGEIVWVQSTVSLIRNEDGAPSNLITITEDVTERKQAERDRKRLLEEAQRARAEAEAANRTKDEFLATLSHELKTPVGIMNIWSEVLRTTSDEALRTRAVEAMSRAVETQARLVDDLLDASRIAMNKVELRLQRCDLHPIIENAIEAVRGAAAAKSLRLRYVRGRRNIAVLGDANRLLQVVANILSNAVKFTPAGGAVTVRSRRATEPRVAEISVRDSGEGIDPELLPHVFEPFRQGDSSSVRMHGGLGLGLAIVSRLVALQNGTVVADSAGRGRGTTLTVKLPQVASRRTADVVAPRRTANELARRLTGVRVLVVDDERDAREGLSILLERTGAEVVTAGCAGDALDEIRRRTPDVLISDIAMPEVDGYALLRTIRGLADQHGARIPAIALTAYETDHDASRALAAGFQLHLPKSVPIVELVEAVVTLQR
jgi:PAS domain S-box-containing protein